MNSFILGELMDELALNFDSVTEGDQKYVKKRILEDDCQEMFPMVSNEFTSDSGFFVDIDESKFLNDSDYACTWIVGNDYDDNVKFLLCLDTYDKEKTLSIEVFEVNRSMRGQGLGANVISVIESFAENHYDYISISPFDTDAINFWEHMGYEECRNGHWVKKL